MTGLIFVAGGVALGLCVIEGDVGATTARGVALILFGSEGAIGAMTGIGFIVEEVWVEGSVVGVALLFAESAVGMRVGIV